MHVGRRRLRARPALPRAGVDRGARAPAAATREAVPGRARDARRANRRSSTYAVATAASASTRWNPTTSFARSCEIGASLPLGKGSAGKVFLAWGTTPTTEDVGDIETALLTTRRRGWADSYGEREEGVASVSAPIFGPQRRTARGDLGEWAAGSAGRVSRPSATAPLWSRPPAGSRPSSGVDIVSL